MKKLLLAIGVVLFAIVATLVVANIYSSGWINGRRQAYGEVSYSAVYSLHSPSLQPQLREYLKTQFYYYGSQLEHSEIQRLEKVDYGPVDETPLADIEPFERHADYPNDYYEEIKRIHGAKR